MVVIPELLETFKLRRSQRKVLFQGNANCRYRGHGTDRLASKSLSISRGNASVINARPGTTAEVGLGQIPQLFETREQFPHSLAQAHE